MSPEDHRKSHEWHVAINKFSIARAAGADWPRHIYEAKKMAYEMPRMISLHRAERLGKLPGFHQQCSHSDPVKIENSLTCCLGVKCRECPELKALEAAELTPEQIDEAKAWTCAAHIVGRGGDVMNEGYLLTVSDRMFWDNVYQSLAASNGTDPG